MDNDLLNMENIKKCCIMKKIYFTEHCLNRMNQSDISISDVKRGIKNGKIIEYYYKDYPYPSCLILGYHRKNKKLHIVCGINENIIYIITAYYPNENKWEKDMKTRRKEL